MHTTPTRSTRLFPQQTRLIHASEGVRLRVVAGRLWLTQPNVAQDLFLGPGDVVDLMQDWVVVGADAEPGGQSAAQRFCCAYELQPLVARKPPQGLVQAIWMGIELAIRWCRGRAGVGWTRATRPSVAAKEVAQRA